MKDFSLLEQTAILCHQANKVWCEINGDNSQVNWENAPEWQKASVRKGVQFVLDNPDAPVSANHEWWSKEKYKQGWTYGHVKDEEKKTHPCLVPFEQLDFVQQTKDYLFKSIVLSIIRG